MLPPCASTARQESSALAGGFRETPFPSTLSQTVSGRIVHVNQKGAPGQGNRVKESA